MKIITRGGMIATISVSLFASLSLSAQDINADFISNGFTTDESSYKSTEKPATQQVVFKVGAGTTFPVDIPDNDSAGVDIEIEAANFVGNIESVTLEIEMEHTFVGDLTATLTAPDGIARLVIFSGVDKKIGAPLTAGDNSNLSGTYTFNDQALNDLWEEAVNVGGSDEVIPADFYRTSTSGNPSHLFGGCTTRLNGAFGGLTPTQANGTWVLNIKDEESFDTGQVLAVGLLLDEEVSPNDMIFVSSFELKDQYTPISFPQASNVLGECSKAQFDYTGTGFSDYVHVYETDEMVVQFKQNNGDSVGDLIFIQDLPTPLSSNPQITSGGDFDGDGIQDIVFSVNREDGLPVTRYLVRRSSRPDDLYMTITADNVFDTQFGDYDGDGLDDFAGVFHDDFIGNAAFLIIDSSLSSSGLSVRNFIIGTAGADDDHRTAGGFDHNGDGTADVSVLTVDGPGRLVDVFNGVDGSVLLDGANNFVGGLLQLPGNFLAPNSSGISTVFPFSSGFTFEAREEDLLAVFRGEVFGDGTGVPVTGDYDGDGLDDFGLWIPDTDGMGNRFLILPSSSADPQNNVIEVTDPQYTSGDYPVGNSRVR